jgi:VIT1/CCC1 family predicted Fe2+/Mn2+ transporter
MTKIAPSLKKKILIAQKNEITEYIIYDKLSNSIKNGNKKILKQISLDEFRHHDFWKKYTKKEIKPSKWKIWKYYWISRLFGITFGIKLMERGEENAQINYKEIAKNIPAVKNIINDENEHEKKLINIINEERLQYMGSVVLGLNDALVELTGALAGFTLALQKTKLIAFMGLITGIAASLSMGASEYLSTKSEAGTKNPLKASVYTTIAYVFTVLFLILPYLIFSNIYLALGITLLNAFIIILIFTYYISIAKDLDFEKRFSEMALISLGVAALSFGIGFLIRIFFNVEI